MYNSTEQELAKEQDEARSFVKSANGVRYHPMPDPTLVQHRSFKNHSFKNSIQQTDSNGVWKQPLLCKVLLQREFVSAKTSYLKFDLAVNTTGVVHNGGPAVRWNSSVLDLFQSVRLTARDGTVLEYIENLDTLASTIAQTTYETDYLEYGAGKLAGYNAADEISDGSDYRTYIVPLRFFLGIASAEDLLPPQLLDGCTLEIHLNNINRAICRVHDGIGPGEINIGLDSATCAIRACTLVTDSYLFDHKLYNLIEQEYESGGLAIKYTSWTSTRQPVSDVAQNLAFPIRQSATRATKLIGKITTTATETYLQGYNDNYKSRDGSHPFTSLQAHHANRAIPDRPITQEVESQFMWLAAFHKTCGGCTAVSRKFLEEYGRRHAFVMSLDRGLDKKTTSGVTVSTKYPLRLELAVTQLQPPMNADLWLNSAFMSQFTFQRYLDTFLEHERVVVAMPTGMRVLI